MAAEALRAAAAESGEAGDHMISGLHRGHLGAHRLHDARALVTQDDRLVQREPPDAVDDVQIAVAHAGRRRAHEDLTPPGLVDLHRFDGQGLVYLPEDGGLHVHAHFLQSSHAQTARPITRSRSRPDSHGSSSVNMVTHWRHEHGMRVMSVPQNIRSGPKAS